MSLVASSLGRMDRCDQRHLPAVFEHDTHLGHQPVVDVDQVVGMALGKLFGTFDQALVAGHNAVVVVKRVERGGIHTVDSQKRRTRLFVQPPCVPGGEHIDRQPSFHRWKPAQHRHQFRHMFSHASDDIGGVFPRDQQHTHAFSRQLLSDQTGSWGVAVADPVANFKIGCAPAGWQFASTQTRQR